MKRLYLYFFALCLASFYFGSYGFWSIQNLRFALVPVLFFFTVLRAHKRRRAFPTSVNAALFAFVVYALATAIWSENAQLSVLKVALFSSVAFTFALGGSLLPELCPELNPFTPLAPIFLLAFASSVLAFGSQAAFLQGNFRGSAYNANMLAATYVFTFPWLVVQLYRTWNRWRLRYVLLAIGAITVILLVISRSRTMMASAVVGLTVVFVYLKPGRKVASVYALAVLLVLTFTFKPELYTDLNQTYVLKSRENLFESRGEQLQESYAAAKQGGFWGAGFGVSVGISRYWDGTTGFSEFSREKGSSLLAVWEETGAPGTALYLTVLLLLVMGIVRFGSAARDDADLRFYKHVLLGFLFSAITCSVFEAWVLSPSPLTATFWATLGMGFGALRRTDAEASVIQPPQTVFAPQSYTVPGT